MKMRSSSAPSSRVVSRAEADYVELGPLEATLKYGLRFRKKLEAENIALLQAEAVREGRQQMSDCKLATTAKTFIPSDDKRSLSF